MSDYRFEDIRAFFVKRQWLVSKTSPTVCEISEKEYVALKERTFKTPPHRAVCLRAYISGYFHAKGQSHRWEGGRIILRGHVSGRSAPGHPNYVPARWVDLKY